MLVQITAPGRSRQATRPPVSVALVLDRSGSMAGRKMELARKAVDHAVRLLRDQDHLAVVSFDTSIDTVLGCTHATAEAKTLAKNRLNAIDARGGTDLNAGWSRGASELMTNESAGRSRGASEEVRRVLLLTDGQANEGETNHDTLAAYAATMRTAGVQTTTFGLGHDFDEVLLSRLAREGGGNFYYVEAPEQIPDFFASELGETLEVVARDAEVVITGGQGVRVTCLHDFPARPTADGTGVHIRLGDLVAEQELTVLVAIECTAGDVGSTLSAEVRLADRDHVLFGAPMLVEWQVVDADTDRTQHASGPVLVEVATVIASRANEAALNANRAGHFDRAEAIILEAVAAIRALGDFPAVHRIAGKLVTQMAVLGSPMDLYQSKAMYAQSMNALRSRSVEGKAKRRTPSPRP